MKKTLQEKLLARQVKTPNGLLYWILMLVVKVLNRKTHTTFRYKADPRKDREPFIIISNHASRCAIPISSTMWWDITSFFDSRPACC
mgnify:CR=1 FL=1